MVAAFAVALMMIPKRMRKHQAGAGDNTADTSGDEIVADARIPQAVD
jgi:hypothetical protein